MNKAEIISYIKQNKSAEIAELQKRFDINYKGAKEVIDELISQGDLVYAEGVRYNYVGNDKNYQEKQREELEHAKAKAIKKIQGSVIEEPDPQKYHSIREYFEARRREFEARRKELKSDKEDDDDDEENDEYLEEDDECDEDEDVMNDDELRQKALKLCIERGLASVSMFQRTFPIGYIRACNLIDWMEDQGYISAAKGPWTRKVLITEEEYDKLYNHDRLDVDDDDFDEDDEKFSTISDLFHYANKKAERNSAPINSEEQKPAIQSLVNIINRTAERKKEPIRADVIPNHDLWVDNEKFTEAVMERIKALIRSDKKMGRQGAVNKAEMYLEAVRDTHDRKMVQVYERLVYEIKNTSNYLYGQLKKQFFED